MDEGVFRQPKRHWWKWMLGILAVLAVLIGAAVFVFEVNRYTLTLTLNGEPSMDVEYVDSEPRLP